MGSERALWHCVRKGMAPYWIAQRIEDRFAEGVPDLFFALRRPLRPLPENGRGSEPDSSLGESEPLLNSWRGGQGWIELKYRASWPKRESTPVRIPGFSVVQRAWIKRMGSVTGSVFLLAQIARDYLLFDWAVAQCVGDHNRADLMELVIARWEGSVDFADLAWRLSISWTDFSTR